MQGFCALWQARYRQLLCYGVLYPQISPLVTSHLVRVGLRATETEIEMRASLYILPYFSYRHCSCLC